MHLISIRNLRIDVSRFPDVKKQIEDWYATVKKAGLIGKISKMLE